MPLTIDDVIAPVSAEQVEQEILDVCATLGLQTTAWQQGSVIRTFIKVMSQEIATKSAMDPEIAKGGFGDLASPDWAKLWADAIYAVAFVPAAPAVGLVTFTNTEPTQYDADPGEIIVAHFLTGKTYRNQAAISILASSTLPNVVVQADEVGTASNAAPNEITTMVTTLVGVTVTNPAAVLGADEETTDALVARTRTKLGSLSPLGPKEAYNYVVQTPEFSPTSTPITRSRTAANPSIGTVLVYLATASGPPTPADVAICQAAIDQWAEPWCVEALALAATSLVVPVTYQVWLKSSLTQAQVLSAIAGALASYLASVPVGGALVPPDTGAVYVERLLHVIHNATPGIELVEITVPAADVVVAPSQVPVLGTVTGTITFI